MEKENTRFPERFVHEELNPEASSSAIMPNIEKDLGFEKYEKENQVAETKEDDIEKHPQELPVVQDSPSKKSPPILFKSERQEYWLDKRNPELEEAYKKIAPGIPLVNVNHKKLFLEKCKEYYKEMVSLSSDIKSIDRWDEYEIIRMFGKGLNPTSLKTALNDITYLVDNIEPSGDTVRVIEYGPGSGWSTLMLRNKLHEKFKDKKIELYSVDISPHSIVATQNSLDYYQIPWQTKMSTEDASLIEKSDEYVTLVTGDFIEFTKLQPDNYFDGFFSSHGTAYLCEDEYKKLLEVSKVKGKKNALFVVDSLDPMYTVQLNTLHLIYCSIFPSLTKKMPEYVYGKSVVSNSKYFGGQEVKKLTKVHNKESDLFYNWNHYLLSKLKVSYILQMLLSMKVTTDVIDEYRDDVYPSYMLKDLIKKEDLNSWVAMDDLPECPLYITNCGLVLKK